MSLQTTPAGHRTSPEGASQYRLHCGTRPGEPRPAADRQQPEKQDPLMQPRKQEHEGFYELLVYKRLWLLVREGGFEPPYLGCWILSPVRLPVPPLSQRYINSLFAGGPQAAPPPRGKQGLCAMDARRPNSLNATARPCRRSSAEALRPPRGPGLRRSPACPAPAPASPAARPAANSAK